MKLELRKVKTVLMATLVFGLTVGVTACTEAEAEEVQKETAKDDHPTNQEHPSGQEHPAAEDEEHPASESDEHPAVNEDEHPA